ncbi:MAG: hypothetical protein ACRC7C_12030 [Beijerinckiaceae bacterium]
MKSERIVTYTAEELRALQVKAGPRDWARFDSISHDDLARLIAEDPDDDDGATADWSTILPQPETFAGIEPELLQLLPPPGPARNAEIRRIIRDHLKRKAARGKRAS